jgi:isopropylmalate/homocitrate/citramalate synthase
MKKKCEFQIYDNTLRDGEQTAGVSFSPSDKVSIARALVAANIRCFEAGFAGVSPEERAGIRAVTDLGLEAKIFSLARLKQADIDAAHQAGVHGVTLIAPASDALIQARTGMSAEQMEKEITSAIEYAVQKKLKVKFSCVDASRAPFDRLIRWYRLAREAGANMVSYADTVGVATPEAITRTIKELKRILQMPVSLHAHNDLGLAVANSLAAVSAGADEVQVTVNGLGERAGNTPLEEFVMALRVGCQMEPGIDLLAMMALSRTVSRITGIEVAANKPVIGKNVFRHESGIHVQGLLHPELSTYEPFPPELIGRHHEVAFGKHSGKSNLRHLCQEYGMVMSPEQEAQTLQKIKTQAQAQKRELGKSEVLQSILKPWHTWALA